MPLSEQLLTDILKKLQQHSTSVTEFVVTLLSRGNFIEPEMHATEVAALLNTLYTTPTTHKDVAEWCHQRMMEEYAREIMGLVVAPAGLHFVAQKATVERLESISIDDVAERMRTIAPHVWELLGTLLAADPDAETHKRQERERWRRKNHPVKFAPKDTDGDVIMGNATINESTPGDIDADVYWETIAPARDPLCGEEEPGGDHDDDEAQERRKALLVIKQVVCMSIMLQSTNQRCNALQSLLGIFLHACNTPETVVELLAHIGVSISTTAINYAITNLSKEAKIELRELAHTFLASYAYDNVDVDLQHGTPTLENPLPTLVHLTSATCIPLQGVTVADLDVSEDLWETSFVNPNYRRSGQDREYTDIDLLTLFPDEEDLTGLTRRDRFNAWVFLRDLVNHGPEYFRRFRKELGKVEVVEQVPIVKMKQIHARMMDTPCATAAENAAVLDDLLSRQAGVGELKEDGKNIKPVGNMVLIVYGDLGVGERLQSLRASRAEEATPWRRCQYLVYGLGLFHVKMACVDALWRIFIQKPASRHEDDDHSLMKHVNILRPRETKKMETKPGFRRMHTTILHSGIVSRLDCWRVLVAGKYHMKSLNDYAQTTPTLDELRAIANTLARSFVATERFSSERRLPDFQRDKVNENMKIRHQYFLLYEQFTHAANHGDIGTVESTFMPWIWIFQSCGKHKYASYLRKHLRDVHFIFPEGLKKAVRMNILVNPTGKPGHFRGVDWVVEHNNLFLKRIYGGKLSNHTKARILKESPLIGVFKNARQQVERLFQMTHQTTRQSEPKMRRTFNKLAKFLEETATGNHFEPGRDTKYLIPHCLVEGQHLATTQKWKPFRGEWIALDDENDEWVDEEVEELGDLEE